MNFEGNNKKDLSDIKIVQLILKFGQTKKEQFPTPFRAEIPNCISPWWSLTVAHPPTRIIGSVHFHNLVQWTVQKYEYIFELPNKSEKIVKKQLSILK